MEETTGIQKSSNDSQSHSEEEILEKMGEMSVEKKGKSQDKEGKKGKRVKDAEHMNRAITQTLSSLHTSEEKIMCLSKKYAELMVEHKALQREVKVQQKQYATLQREKDHLQSEHGRAVLAKSKLESLCRELQRHNKTIKEESLQRSKEEEEKRKEVSAKFQQTINDITTQMQENHTRNLKLKEENLDLATKLKSLVEQYERREEHIEKLFKHKELESQLYDAKIQQANIALAEEKEKYQRDKALWMVEAAENRRKCDVLTKQESELKAQLTVYTEKFEEFQSTLTKSNDVFQTLKQEMDKMTKKIKKLEKETNMWRIRWENTNKSLLATAEQKNHHERESAENRNKVVRLEKLCRALQGERNALLDKARAESNASETSCQQQVEEKEANRRGEEISCLSQEDSKAENVEESSQQDSSKLQEACSSIQDID
ncbi:alpha-taxilin-like isoform X2 [Acanthaster planci]|uniref:Alpha-taxilin-like isoform X2 n=1 Tax=Acanthaster planci TaxID=133434 RepID=A0A8B7YDX5_ACAPL|nr:alpha-taxilin-like isoform X2 [Acanthaster planci]